MQIEKKSYVDQVEVAHNGCVQVRTRTDIVENGNVISYSLHRHVVAPGDDYSNEDEKVKSICAAMHTPSVIEAYKSSLEIFKTEQGV